MISFFFSFGGAEFNLQNKPHLLFYLFPVALKATSTVRAFDLFSAYLLF